MQKTTIGIAGRKYHGKSTVASLLRGERIAFADSLKEMLLTLGVPWDHLYGKCKEVPLDMLGGKSGRDAMVTLGTEWGRRMIHRDLWVKALERKLQRSDAEIIVVDDVRFPSEVECIRRLGGFVLAVERERPSLWWRIKRWFGFIHESEALDFDEHQIPVVDNTSTLDNLHKNLSELLENNHLGYVLK